MFRILSLWPGYRSSDSRITPLQIGMRIWHNPWMTKRSTRRICNWELWIADMDLDPVPYPIIGLQVNARKQQNFAFKHPILNSIPIRCRYFQEVSSRFWWIFQNRNFTVLPFKYSPVLRIRIRSPGSGSEIRIRCLFDPGSGIDFYRITDLVSQTYIFGSLMTIFWVKSSMILCKLAPILSSPLQE